MQSSSQTVTTNKPTPNFYRSDALLVAQPTVSKHWRKHTWRMKVAHQLQQQQPMPLVTAITCHNKLCGRPLHYAPDPCKLTWPFDLESGVRVTCDVGLCANFSLPMPLCSQFRPNVRNRQTSDVHHRLMPLLWGWGA